MATPKSDKVGVPRSVSDVLGIKPFYPDLDRVNFSDLKDRTVVLEDADIIEAFQSEYGAHDLALIRFRYVGQPEDEPSMTTACSGMVVVKKIAQLRREAMFPVSAVVKQDGRYWDIV